MPWWLRAVERLCLVACASVRTGLDKEDSWKERLVTLLQWLEPVENFVLVAGIYWNHPHRNMVGSHPPDLGPSRKETQKGSLGNRKNDSRFELTDFILNEWKRSEQCYLCTGRFPPCSLHWLSPLTASSRPSTSHSAWRTQHLSHNLPSLPAITSNMAANRSLRIHSAKHGNPGSGRMGMERACLWKYSSLGMRIRSILQIPKCAPKMPSFPDGSGSSPFSLADFLWEQILVLGFAHLLTLHCNLLFIPNSFPWRGTDSCAVLCQVAPSLLLFFYFAVVVVLYFLVAFFSHIFPCPPFPSEFYFSAQKNLTSIPKKMKLQKLKFKKNLKKKYSTILSALLTFSIVSCDLCLVLCSIDAEHLIMNVLVYSDKGKKKPKKRSEFNSVYNKNFKNDPHSTQNRMGNFPFSFCDNAHHSCISF